LNLSDGKDKISIRGYQLIRATSLSICILICIKLTVATRLDPLHAKSFKALEQNEISFES